MYVPVLQSERNSILLRSQCDLWDIQATLTEEYLICSKPHLIEYNNHFADGDCVCGFAF